MRRLGTTADARAGKLTFIIGGDPKAVERCRPIFAGLAEHTFHAGPPGSGHAGAVLDDFLRGAQILAASEALSIGQRFGMDTQSVVEIGEMLSGVGQALSAMLREQVLTWRFATGMALGHVLRGLEVTTSLAQSTGVHAPLAAACRAAWEAAEAQRGSGADQSEMIRWLDTAVVPERKEES
jgi:3-hydroxyisobutyrate dehydrogenase